MKLEYKLLRHQKELYQSKAPIAGIYGGRGCGKSRILSLMIAMNLVQGKRSLIFAQNYRSLSLNLFAEIRNRLDEMKVPYEFNKASMIITYESGMVIGATYEAVDAIRGMTEIEYMYLDEIALAPPELLSIAVPVMRGDFEPKIRFASTPRIGSFWDQWIKNGIKDGSIEVFTAKMTDNTFLSKESIDMAFNAIVDDKLKAQELLGQILDASDDTCIIYPQDLVDKESIDDSDDVYFGIDASGQGQDLFTIAIRKGHKILSLTEYKTLTGQQCLSELRKLCGQYNIRKNQIKSINLDMAYSEALYEALLPEYEMTRTIAFAAKPPDKQYANMRAYGYMMLARLIKDGMYIQSRDVREELLNTHWKLDNYDRILIQPKEEIKFIIKRSPDRADAVMLTCIEQEAEDTLYVTITPEKQKSYINTFFR